MRIYHGIISSEVDNFDDLELLDFTIQFTVKFYQKG